jgi:hypothetical protein
MNTGLEKLKEKELQVANDKADTVGGHFYLCLSSLEFPVHKSLMMLIHYIVTTIVQIFTSIRIKYSWFYV